MKSILTVAAALIAGFIGGLIGTRLSGARDQVIARAHSFELLDESGEVISFWGVDSGHNAVLAFGNRGRAPGGAHPQSVPAGLANPDNQLSAVGLFSDDNPMLKMSGSDGRTRVRLYLSTDGKPFLLMEDDTGPRVSLGIEQSDTPGPEDNNWSLAFYPERARIGMNTLKEGGRRYVVGTFSLNKDKIEYPYRQRK